MTDIRRRLLRGMADIVTDLYAAPASAATPDVPPASVPQPGEQQQIALPPFEALWKTADESIDWTDALASPTPTDGVTPPERWAKYHALADRVLHGDTAAYLDALTCINPVADLTPYVASLDVQTRSADVILATFDVRPDLMADAQPYLCGMALRIARDLFATVPVTQVDVTAQQGDSVLLRVSFSRAEMNRVRFAFVDPVDFVHRCGGTP